ncbi:response regulator [Desulfosarcina cetonica]|uniref:response regulator n=1 Tax=Desulfosarcina cetonica TaxID=90730 RepID=UPI001C45554A|nr:response regulator [Desulfosarcina cetonica]
MLETTGYHVLAALTPKEALALADLHAGRIDLLMTDVIMPEMNGRELSEKVAARCPDIGIVYMSGYTANLIAHRGVLEEGVSFIQKPFSRKELAVKVRSVLDGKAAVAR